MKNAEICWSDSISEFRIPGFRRLGVGDVKDPHDRSPEAAKCETPKYVGLTPFRSFGYQDFIDRELEMSRTLTTGVPKWRNVKRRNMLVRLHFGVSDTGISQTGKSKNKGTLTFEVAICEIVK
jgi:hypothetical protein